MDTKDKKISDIKFMEENRSGKWKRQMQPVAMVIGLGFGLLFPMFLIGIRPSSFILSQEQTSSPQKNAGQQHEFDRLFGGLLSPDFDNKSCISRYKSPMYRKSSPYRPSFYLKQKIRRYEENHKKCGPGTESYLKAVQQLKSGKNSEDSDCQYMVWLKNYNGLGNRMLSLVSTFLFSILTNRVMLIEMTDEMSDLFCEPFPWSSWVVPPDFPINEFWRYHIDAPQSYTCMVNNKTIGNHVNVSAESLPSYVYLHLENVNLRLVNHLFCEKDQKIFQKINWVLLRSESYFAVALFLLPMYREELEHMFPVKESVSHILGRYLFHPANQVWGLIERYYDTYLSNADELIGLQIRIVPNYNVTFEKVFNGILDCSRKTNLLPELGPTNSTIFPSKAKKRVAVLVVSLFSEYYEKIKSMYYESSTVNGETVAVYQPTHEGTEKNSERSHNKKALAEIFLLSFCDEIATTSWSTFGYMSSSLGGLSPRILIFEAACIRPESIDPCLQSPPILRCDGNKDTNPAELVPYVRSCEDVSGGIKVFGKGDSMVQLF